MFIELFVYLDSPSRFSAYALVCTDEALAFSFRSEVFEFLDADATLNNLISFNFLKLCYISTPLALWAALVWAISEDDS